MIQTNIPGPGDGRAAPGRLARLLAQDGGQCRGGRSAH